MNKEIGVQAAATAYTHTQRWSEWEQNSKKRLHNNSNVTHLIFILMSVSFIYFKKFYANLKIYYPIMNWVVYGCLPLS